ncbi:hypothetical protein LCGC14_3149880, partial [marine sediment metagenome]
MLNQSMTCDWTPDPNAYPFRGAVQRRLLRQVWRDPGNPAFIQGVALSTVLAHNRSIFHLPLLGNPCQSVPRDPEPFPLPQEGFALEPVLESPEPTLDPIPVGTESADLSTLSDLV